MFCQKCGRTMRSDDHFCGYCGYSAGGKDGQKDGRKRQSATAALIVIGVIVLLVGFSAAAYRTMRGLLPSPGPSEVPALPSRSTSAPSSTTETEPAPWTTTTAAAETTAGQTATTAPTTAATTAAPTESPTAKADKLRAMLLAHKWKTTVEGINATITFSQDGKAKISARVLFFTQNIDAVYTVADDCTCTIRFSYNGTDYHIAGKARAEGDRRIIITSGSGEEHTLDAAD